MAAPQCPLNEQWVVSPPPWDNYDFTKAPITDNLKAVMAILDSFEREFPIDKDREYISGMSMGGQGTWYSIMAFPERFAAAVPVCGSSDPNQAPNLDAVNIWTVHAADDNVVAARSRPDSRCCSPCKRKTANGSSPATYSLPPKPPPSKPPPSTTRHEMKITIVGS